MQVGTKRNAASQTPGGRTTATSSSAGFTLLELIFVISGIALLMGIIVPNLSSMVPSARLNGSAKAIATKLTMIRSEARIQAKRMELELDLDKARFRTIYPPEEQLTTDQTVYNDADLNDRQKDWIDIETGVRFVGAGDAKGGMADKGLYRVVFDEYGFSADQVIALALESDDTMVWSIVIRGLTGKIDIERSEEGDMFRPTAVGEGAF